MLRTATIVLFALIVSTGGGYLLLLGNATRRGERWAESDWAAQAVQLYDRKSTIVSRERRVYQSAYDPETGLRVADPWPIREGRWARHFYEVRIAAYSRRVRRLLESRGPAPWSVKQHLVPFEAMSSVLSTRGVVAVDEFPCELPGGARLVKVTEGGRTWIYKEGRKSGLHRLQDAAEPLYLIKLHSYPGATCIRSGDWRVLCIADEKIICSMYQEDVLLTGGPTLFADERQLEE